MALLKRKQTPLFRKTVGYYKPFLREDFNYRCAYCKNHEAVEGGSKNFQIDHYKPQKKYPKLKHVYSNLFYSCKECNSSKKDYVPSIVQLILREYVLNPCDHDFEIHYDMHHPEWKEKTSTAFWNIKKLRLNSPERIQIRKDEVYGILKIDELTSKEEELKEILSSNQLSELLQARAREDLLNIQNEISFYKRKTIEKLD